MKRSSYLKLNYILLINEPSLLLQYEEVLVVHKHSAVQAMVFLFQDRNN